MKKLLLASLLLVSCMQRTEEITVTGKDGLPGVNGTSCSVAQLSNGALLSCTDGTSALVYNGVNGTNAPQQLGIAGYIFPCGDQHANDEIFFRMTDGSIIALYDGGATLDRLTRLEPGNYVTTDSAGTCNINVDINLNVTTSPQMATGLAVRP